MTTLFSGYSDKKEIDIASHRELYNQFSDITFSVSSTPLGIIAGLREYLKNYAYGCSEQLISRNFPNVTLYDQKDLISSLSINQDELDKSLAQVFADLRERQNFEGGFSMWNDFGITHNFVSAYVMHFLTEAASKNLPIPSDTFRSGLSYLKNMSNRSIGSLKEAREKAYAIYVLTRNNEISTNYIANVLSYLEANHKDNWKDDLAAIYIAASYKMLHMTNEANRLIDSFNPATELNSNSSDEYNFYNKFIKYSQYLYIMSTHFPEKLNLIDQRLLQAITNLVDEGSYNTINSAYGIMAIAAYSNVTSDLPDTKFNLRIFGNTNQEPKELSLTGKRIKIATIPADFNTIKLNATIPNFYYQLTTKGFDKNTSNIAIFNGLELSKKYFNESGIESKIVKLGEVLNVLIAIRADNTVLDNIAIIDLLPGGFELVPDQRTDDLKDWEPNYVDRREDRILIFGSIPNYEVTYQYKIKAVNMGAFTAPLCYAESMYFPNINARSTMDIIKVE